jgi:hypothetical protein
MNIGNAVRFWGVVFALFVAASPSAMASTPLLTQETKLQP